MRARVTLCPRCRAAEKHKNCSYCLVCKRELHLVAQRLRRKGTRAIPKHDQDCCNCGDPKCSGVYCQVVRA